MQQRYMTYVGEKIKHFVRMYQKQTKNKKKINRYNYYIYNSFSIVIGHKNL